MTGFFLLILNHYFCSDGNDVKKLLNILIFHAHATGRYLLPDAFGMKSAVDAVMRVPIKTHPAAAQFILRAFGGEGGPPFLNHTGFSIFEAILKVPTGVILSFPVDT